ncbi:GTPase domain-containing protein [Tsukamurella sp. M9C]|uniref:GTPase domain-containing protein n=1 Tax=Tsukamurella sp. M9C TaxID=2877520 RepID=UPI001CCAC75B|nr:GTPase domain-containing protein [Tsukamurella sp. M9C]MCA0156400.1 GTPase domain-containing protein [Tsukamurella sp. M9C]
MNIEHAKQWYEEAAEDGSAVEEWVAFIGDPRPVVTVLGSYDVGKSSLVRRLLVDAGVDVPDWLTISARHETFDVNEAGVHGIRLRDTPGLAVGAGDARGLSNSAHALASSMATDVLVVVLTPQLATGELDVLRTILARGWDPGTLWFVISRFDEAGVDPETDPAGYSDLADRKRAELRAAFALAEDVPVFVVAADGFQYAASEHDPDPAVWESNRAWDGMGDLSAALDGIVDESTSLRGSAADRYWRTIVRGVCDDIATQLPDMESAAAQALLVEQATQAWREELEHLDAAAKASLRGILAVSARDGYTSSPESWSNVGPALSQSVDSWITQETGELDRLANDVNRSARTERQSPNWQKLDELVSAAIDYEVDDVETPELHEKLRRYAPYVVQAVVVGVPLITHLRSTGLDGIGDLEKFVAAQAGRVGKVNAGADFVIDRVAPLVEEALINHAQARAEATAWRGHVDSFIEKVHEIALQQWEARVSETAELIEVAGGGQAQLADGLRAALEDARERCAAGRGLLRPE